MIDIKKYTDVQDSIDFINMLYDSFKSSYSIDFQYNHKDYLIITKDGKGVDIYINENYNKTFNTIDALLLEFKINNKPLIEIIDYIEYPIVD